MQKGLFSKRNDGADRRRVAAPDLEITVVKGRTTASKDAEAPAKGNEVVATKTFVYNSTVMAYYFGYFDSLLSSGMSETETKQVTLEEMDPDIFEMAVEFLIDSSKFRTFNPTKIMKAAYIYDRLDSDQGFQLIESVVMKYIENPKFDSHPEEIQAVIEAISTMENFLCETNKEQTLDFLKQLFSYCGDNRSDILDSEKLLMLKPVLAENPVIVRHFHAKFCNPNSRLVTGDNPTFPQWFQSQIHALAKFDVIESMRKISFGIIWQIEDDVASSGQVSLLPHNNIFCESYQSTILRYRDVLYNSVRLGPAVCMNLQHGVADLDYAYGDWAIVFIGHDFQDGDDSSTLHQLEFIAPNSTFHGLPPTSTKWKAVPFASDGHVPKIHLKLVRKTR